MTFLGKNVLIETLKRSSVCQVNIAIAMNITWLEYFFFFQVEFVKNSGVLTVRTSESSGHFHDIKIHWYSNIKFGIVSCDSKDDGWLKCWDKHPGRLVPMPADE